MFVAVLVASGSAAPTASATSPRILTSVCDTAADLTLLGDPAGAIKAITTLRAAEPVPAGTRPLCAREYADAASRQARASRLVAWANRLDAQVADATTFPLLLDGVPPKVCTGKPIDTASDVSKKRAEELIGLAARAAATCDRHNKAAMDLLTSLAPSDKTLAETSNTAWTRFRTTSLDPWVPLALAFLVWAAIVLVLARLLLVLLGRVPPTRKSAATLRGLRALGITTGWVALVLSGGLAVGATSLVQLQGGDRLALSVIVLFVATTVTVIGLLSAKAGTWPRVAVTLVGAVLALGAVVVAALTGALSVSGSLDPHIWWGAGAALVSAFAFALAWGAGPRLTITSKGDADAPATEYLRTLTTLLGASPPRGLEVPSGTDADFLTWIGISETPGNPLVAAVVRVLKLSLPPTPWQLVVTAHSADLMTAELTRNRRLVDTETIQRGAMFRFLDGVGAADTDDTLPLAPFAAAFAVLRIASAHGLRQGLAGAQRPRSVALQYLGALRPRGDTSTEAIFAEALSRDPQNMLARISYWHSLYRAADSVEKLVRYRALLDGVLTGSSLADEPALRLRVLYTRVAVGINLRSLDGVDPGLEAAATTLLAEAVRPLTDDAETFRNTLLESARVLVRSIPDVTDPTPDPEEPESNGPSVNYAWGCYFATNGEDPDRALRHLQLSNENPELAAWRRSDPQLKAFRDSQTYREAFGDPVPADILSVSPFRDHAQRLRSAGLVNAERLAEASVVDLADLGLKPPAARWVRQLALLGQSLPDGLAAWRVPIVAAFAEQGWVSVPSTAEERESLRDAITKACGPLTTSPDPGQLTTWLSSS